MKANSCHISVLLKETIDALAPVAGGVYMDCTFGGGGHARELLNRAEQISLHAFDRDGRALERAPEPLKNNESVKLTHSKFSAIQTHVTGIKFNGIMADLGISSDQLAEMRGFSFHDTGPLDMRMDESQGMTVEDFLESASEREIARALSVGGVRKLAQRYAKAIKQSLPISSPAALAACIVEATPAAMRYERDAHPATVVFQALRIAINQEYEEIEALLSAIPQMAAGGCRVAIICFHSGEDKLVAERFRKWSRGDSVPASWRGPRPETTKPKGTLLTKEAIYPSEQEVERNPRSRSARLRVFEFFTEEYVSSNSRRES